MAKPKDVSADWWEALQREVAVGVGCHATVPRAFPAGFSDIPISRRTAPTVFCIGSRDDQAQVLVALQIQPYMRGAFEKEHPVYAGHHRAAKPFLRKGQL